MPSIFSLMENVKDEKAIEQVYQIAANMMIKDEMTAGETKRVLVKLGIDEKNAEAVVTNIEDQIDDAQRKRANKDMIFGALWCVGGTIATLANFGYIFWGAIVFGAIQFIRGVSKR